MSTREKATFKRVMSMFMRNIFFIFLFLFLGVQPAFASNLIGIFEPFQIEIKKLRLEGFYLLTNE